MNPHILDEAVFNSHKWCVVQTNSIEQVNNYDLLNFKYIYLNM